MRKNNKQRSGLRSSQAYITTFRIIGYLLLVGAAFCTMIPLLWLLTSSFKTANEIFAVPIQLFPKLPRRIASSPYIVHDAYPAIQKPKAVEADTWAILLPELERVIWEEASQHIAANPQLAHYERDLDVQTEMIEGIWEQLVTNLPSGVWESTASLQNLPAVVTEVRHAIIPETVNTIWDSIYREVAVGNIQIEDVDFNRTRIPSLKWETDSPAVRDIRESTYSDSVASFSYDFGAENNVHLKATVPLSHSEGGALNIPPERIRLIIIPVRGDASYHQLALEISVNGTTYQPGQPFVLDSHLWENTVWRLHGIPGELESTHIRMHPMPDQNRAQQIGSTSENTLSLRLTIHRPSYLSIVWDKFTSNYRNLWKTVPYNRYFINSVFIATSSTLLTLFFCSLGGYAFAKYRFRGEKVLFSILLASMMVPFQVLLVPLFGLMYDIGWLNSYKAIVIPFSVGAFGVFLMRQFIVSIPTELLDAARIDGCSEFGIYYRIVLPIIKPALGALTIYSFLGSWNGYLWPLIILRDEAKYTLPIGLANLIGIYRQDYGMLMAGTLLSLLPIVILFLSMQREFVQGITLGSVKE